MMMREMTMLPWMMLVGVGLSGCSAEWPFQRKPTQAIRQAQGLVEDNIEAARPHADTAGKAHLAEAASRLQAPVRCVITNVVVKQARLSSR